MIPEDKYIIKRLAEEGLVGAVISPQSSEMLPYEEARLFSRSLGFQSAAEWHSFCRVANLKNIPNNPREYYKDKWVSYMDWLGYHRTNKGKDFLDFENAREFIRQLRLKNREEWRYFSKTARPSNIPSSPDKFYKEWVSWSDWLNY